MPRFSNRTFKKRKFSGKKSNVVAEVKDVENRDKCLPVASTDKLSSNENDFNVFSSTNSRSEIIDIDLISSILKETVLCQQCKKQSISIKFHRIVQGLATELTIFCDNCSTEKHFLNSKVTAVNINNKSTNIYHVNTRLAYAMRSIGKGQSSAKLFCGIMNLPPPPSRFYESVNVLRPAVEKVSGECMRKAAKEAEEDSENTDIPVAVDGTWQKRGHKSLNGVVTATSVNTGKIIDIEVLSRYCTCSNDNHTSSCTANFFGNSGSMEVEGAVKIFQRSLSQYGLRYLNYLGDGDSKAYKAVVAAKPYGEVAIEKLECIGHVEKRMGTRLRRLKDSYKNQKLDDKKSLGGRGRLTDAVIDQLQHYYGYAIRNNTENLPAMKQAVWATFFHKVSTDSDPQHGLCPIGEDSWCGYNRAIHTGEIYRHKNSLPEVVMECIKDVYRDLANPQLLSRCLHGKTQNCNESANSVIWTLIPKVVFVQLDTLRLGALEAVSLFNQGNITKLKVLKELDIEPGYYTYRAMLEADRVRVRAAEKAALQRTKEARVQNRQSRCLLEDKLNDKDNPSYGPGLY